MARSLTTRIALTLLSLSLFIELLPIPPAGAQGPYHTGTTSWTLFQNSWPIQEIFLSNYSSTVHDSSTAWAVDMYASWCGHCQRFAPAWKRLANQLYGWRHLIRFGALACSHPDAEQICIDQGIISYPTLKLFPPRADPSFTGVVHKAVPSETSLRMGIVDFLSELTDAPEEFPNLKPISSTVELLDAAASIKDRDLLLFAENITEHFTTEDNYLGRYVILDVSDQWRRLVVRRVDAPDAANLGIRDFPSLHRVNPADGALLKIASHLDRRGFVSVIKKEVLQMEDNEEENEEGEMEGEAEEPDSTISVTIRLPDGLHDLDLESGVFYSLWREVALHKNFRGARLGALQTHLHHLAELLPVRPLVRRWLRRVDGWLSAQSEPIPRDAWIEQLSRLENARAHLPKRVVWSGCRSSSDPNKRGYPCSLWSIFHALTVGAYQHPEKGISPKAVVQGMREYIHRFFSCSHCREHFMNMSSAINSQIDENSRASGVLWLWRAHNKVNRRLHGDITEDPANPKMQFPTYSKCANCHESRPGNRFRESEWAEDEVMKYLVDYYSDEGVIRDALPYTYKPYVVATPPPVDSDVVNGCCPGTTPIQKVLLFVCFIFVFGGNNFSMHRV